LRSGKFGSSSEFIPDIAHNSGLPALEQLIIRRSLLRQIRAHIDGPDNVVLANRDTDQFR
jgi:hypothetical protein